MTSMLTPCCHVAPHMHSRTHARVKCPACGNYMTADRLVAPVSKSGSGQIAARREPIERGVLSRNPLEHMELNWR